MTKEEVDLIEGMINMIVEKVEQLHDRVTKLETELYLLEYVKIHPPTNFRDTSNGE